MLDFIRDWGRLVPLLVLGWITLAYGVAWWRTKRGFFAVQALINGMWTIFFFFQYVSSNHGGTSLFFTVMIVVGAIVVPIFERKSVFKPYRSGGDLLFFRQPQMDVDDTSLYLPRKWQRISGLSLLVGVPLIAGIASMSQPCQWLDRITGTSGCVAEFANDGSIFGLSYTSDSRSLISSKSNLEPGPMVEMWDSESGKGRVLVSGDIDDRYPYAALSPDGQTLALELTKRQGCSFVISRQA